MKSANRIEVLHLFRCFTHTHKSLTHKSLTYKSLTHTSLTQITHHKSRTDDFAWQAWHFLTWTVTLRGRRGTW